MGCIKKILCSLSLLVFCGVGAITGQAQTGFVADEIIIKLHNPAELPVIASQFRLAPMPLDQFGARPIYRMQILDGQTPLVKSDTMRSDPRIQYAEPNYLSNTPEGTRGRVIWADGTPGTYSQQWAPAKIGLPTAHHFSSGHGAVVAVLDTGIDPTHPALAGKLLPGFDFVDFDNDPSEVGIPFLNPGFGHGTHVAGIIALTAPNAHILPVRVLDPNGQGNLWVLAEALIYAADPDGNPATPDGAHIINLSLGTLRQTSLLNEIIHEIAGPDDDDDDDDDNEDRDDDDGDDDDGDDDDDGGNNSINGLRTVYGQAPGGIVIIAAAGNLSSTSPYYPAAEGVPGLLAVAASTEADTLAGFSNRGSWIHVAAPGENIVSCLPGNIYGSWSGTSMAVPFAAGEAALLRSRSPWMTSVEITERIIQATVAIPGPVPRRIDVGQAIQP